MSSDIRLAHANLDAIWPTNETEDQLGGIPKDSSIIQNQLQELFNHLFWGNQKKPGTKLLNMNASSSAMMEAPNFEYKWWRLNTNSISARLTP